MAKIEGIKHSFMDDILPKYGQPARRTPVWNEGQKMYICDEYESAAGHRYYKGIRFCENLVIVETLGNYYSFTYIDGIEIYAFDGRERCLIGKCKYDKVFYDQDFIKSETKKMVEQYILGQMKLGGNADIDDTRVKEEADALVERCYTSLLDENYLPRIKQMLPELLPQH